MLVENFTWDWIYDGYGGLEPRLARHGAALAALSASADLHVQTEPACRPVASALAVPPVARRRRGAPAAVRRSLGIPDQARLVVLTMGGVGWTYRGLAAAERHRRAWFAVPGGAERPRRRGRVVLLPFHSELFHPDLVQAADVVVGKLGYSTVAETYLARAAMAFLSRPHFRESAVLAEFVRRTAPSAEITEAASTTAAGSPQSTVCSTRRGPPAARQRRAGGGSGDPRSLRRGPSLGSRWAEEPVSQPASASVPVSVPVPDVRARWPSSPSRKRRLKREWSTETGRVRNTKPTMEPR